ncbi:hypothetical protein ACHAXN_003264 [Cyclotella atomus]
MSASDNNSIHSSESSFLYEDSDSDPDYDPTDDSKIAPYSLYNQQPLYCPICCETVQEGSALILPCSHGFCIECFLMYLQTRVGEGDADSISCPHILENGHQCRVVVGDDILREVMEPSEFERLSEMKNTAFVRKNVDYHHCPTPDCTNIVLCKRSVEGGAANNNGDNAARDDATDAQLSGDTQQTVVEPPRICDCFKCGRISCLSCGASPFHTNQTCQEYRERQQFLETQQQQANERQRQWFLEIRQQQANRERIRQARASGQLGLYQSHSRENQYDFLPTASSSNNVDNELPEGIKRCRRCGNGVELKEGCLKMKCLCGYRFCYGCGSENARCSCTGFGHGFFDPVTGRGDFMGLTQERSAT